MDLLEHLHAALTAATRRDRLALLDHLLEAWRATRTPALAALIDAVGADLDRSLAPIAEAGPRGERGRAIPSPRARHQRWLDVCNLCRPADATRLAAALLEGNGPQGREKAERLRKLPHDPRFAAGFVRAIAAGGWTNVPKTFHQLYGYLGEARDVRGLDPLRAELERNAQRAAVRLQASEFLQRTVEQLAQPLPALPPEAAPMLERLAVATRELGALPPLTEAEVLADRGSPSPAAANEEELLARVYQDLDDDSARQVYGDCLLERGDPRGELIALQFKRVTGRRTAKDEKRERDLLKEHVRTWLGPLEPVVDLGKRPGQLGSVVFERGFLAACRTAFKSPTQRRDLVGERRWATCSSLLTDEPALIAHPQMTALRSVGELPLGQLTELVERTAPGLVSLGTEIARARKGQPERLRAAAAREAFPALRRFAIDLRPLWNSPDWAGAWELEDLARSPLLRGLEEIEIELGGPDQAPAVWLPRLAAAAPQRVVLVERQTWRTWRLEATRCEQGWDCVYSGRSGQELQSWDHTTLFTEPLRRLDPAYVHSLVVDVPETWTEDHRIEGGLELLRHLSPTVRRVRTD